MLQERVFGNYFSISRKSSSEMIFTPRLSAFVSLLVLRAVLKMQEDLNPESANGAGKLVFLRKKR